MDVHRTSFLSTPDAWPDSEYPAMLTLCNIGLRSLATLHIDDPFT